MATEALSTARKLLVSASSKNANTSDKRALLSHLITLPSYHDTECTRFFGTLISRHFAEFEDLQDRAVDAVLDLCEDEEEQTRIIGIRGLGSTAKADTRWVRGNAGVLLQLLECPERELREVKSVLALLLNLNANDVLSVMIDDCRNAESETGTSRRNIIEYLHKDCADFRKTVLETGRNSVAEKTLLTGAYDMLKLTAPAESRLILEMLLPLPSVSGPKVTENTTTNFIRALTTSLKADSSASVTLPHMRLLSQYINRNVPLDPKSVLFFFGKHGGAVVELLLEKADPVASVLVQRLHTWAEGAIKRWRASDRKGESRQDVKEFVIAVLEELLGDVKRYVSSDLFDHADALERLLFPVYALLQYGDTKRDMLSRTKCDDLLDLANLAKRALTKYAKTPIEERRLKNMRSMSEAMGDRGVDMESFTPSWVPVPIPPRAAPIPAKTVITGSSTPSSLPTGPSASRSTPSNRYPHSSNPLAASSAPTGPRGSPSEIRRPTSPAREPTPSTPPQPYLGSARAGQEPKSPHESHRGTELLGSSAVPASTSSISIQGSSRGLELLSSGSTTTQPSTSTASNASLPIRSMTIKRARADEETPSTPLQTVNQPSLSSQPNGNDSAVKRARVEGSSEAVSAPSLVDRLSLRDRLNGLRSATASPSPAPATPNMGFSVKGKAAATRSPVPPPVVLSAPRGLSVLGRSTSRAKSATAATASITSNTSSSTISTPTHQRLELLPNTPRGIELLPTPTQRIELLPDPPGRSISINGTSLISQINGHSSNQPTAVQPLKLESPSLLSRMQGAPIGQNKGSLLSRMGPGR